MERVVPVVQPVVLRAVVVLIIRQLAAPVAVATVLRLRVVVMAEGKAAASVAVVVLGRLRTCRGRTWNGSRTRLKSSLLAAAGFFQQFIQLFVDEGLDLRLLQTGQD